MPNDSRALKATGSAAYDVLSAGGALRHEVFNTITPLLLESNGIGNSNTRLMVQAYCLDVVTTVEDVIKRYDLDRCFALRKG